MPALIFDTGFLYSLVSDGRYSAAARDHWGDQELWVPASVRDEMVYRRRNPGAGVRPEFPRDGLGLISSSKWSIRVIELDVDEQRQAEELQVRIGAARNADRGECEAAVLVATRDSQATVLLDDMNCLPVVARFTKDATGEDLRYQTTTTVLDELVSTGNLSEADRGEIGDVLRSKGRPFT